MREKTAVARFRCDHFNWSEGASRKYGETGLILSTPGLVSAMHPPNLHSGGDQFRRKPGTVRQDDRDGGVFS